jgi:hypothetical protein
VKSSSVLAVVLPGFFVVEELRYVFPCGSRWEEASPLLRNKLFQPGLLSADGYSGAIGGKRGKRERALDLEELPTLRPFQILVFPA